jgi:hypothetical protein
LPDPKRTFGEREREDLFREVFSLSLAETVKGRGTGETINGQNRAALSLGLIQRGHVD